MDPRLLIAGMTAPESLYTDWFRQKTNTSRTRQMQKKDMPDMRTSQRVCTNCTYPYYQDGVCWRKLGQ